MLKDLQLEYRQRYAINGMLLYLVSTVVVCYMSFSARGAVLPPPTWNALFWIIMLFTAITAVARSFDAEREGRFIYMYTLASPEAVIVAKIAYNILLLTLLYAVGFIVYVVVLGNPVQDVTLFVLNLFLGAVGLSGTLTLVAGISGRAGQNAMLMPILSFPITVPMLLMLIKVSKNAMDGLDWQFSEERILTLLALDVIVITLSYLLFPYLWRN
jgi:heme exporter protein B